MDTVFHAGTQGVSSFTGQVYLKRPQVDMLLERAMKNSLVTVVAGEGYGKTNAVYSYLRQTGTVTIWIQLSERDNLGLRFLENITRRLAAYNPRVSAALADMGFPDTVRHFDRFHSTIEGALQPGKKYVIVFDDFHLIHARPVLRFIEWAIAVPLFNCSLVLISRNEPAINTVSLLSKGLMTRITAEDLRFSQQEIGAYFKLRNISISTEELSRIYHDTEGWAVAVNLIARESENRKDGTGGYSPSALKESTFKNIEAAFFAGMEKELRKFLIKLSLIEHWHLDLLEKLAVSLADSKADSKHGTGQGGRLIREMESISPFVRYDAGQHSYRLHHLFLEFLKEKQGELSEAEIRVVYTKAAEWCITNNQRTDAAIYYERAADYWGLISIIYSFPVILPDAVAAFLLEIIERVLRREEPRRKDLGLAEEKTGDVLFLRHVVHPRLLMSLGRFAEASCELRQTIAQFEALPSSSLHSRILSRCWNNLGLIAVLINIFARDYNLLPYFEKANYYHMQHPYPLHGPVTHSSVSSYICRVSHPAKKGEFEKSLEAFALIIPYTVNSMNGYFYGMDSLGWAELYYFKGDMNNAEKFALQAVYRAHEKKQYEIEYRALYFLLRMSLGNGDYPAVQELLRKMEDQLEITEYINRYTIYYIGSGWFYAQIGATEKLESWLKGDFEESELNTMLHGFEILVKAKCAFVDKQYQSALETLNEHQENKYGLGNFLLGKIEMTLLQAVSLYRLREAAVTADSETGPEDAIRKLETAWDMARSNSLDTPFVELGEVMRDLLGAALKDTKCTIPRPWLEMIRSKASAYGKKLSLVAKQFHSQGGLQTVRPQCDSLQPAGPTLTWRERDILISLSRGLNRAEIAGNLAVSVNTVKADIGNLYAKLGARNRPDAIRIAVKLNILAVRV
ncbi:hypothetical protein AGMMS50267_07830 [Spirochaetia bacterium]|nr:hypothetical protein AGMMS50267_07830 [Spirochaetia bacterium]